MKITYSKDANAAYIYLAPIGPGEVGSRAGGEGRTVDVEGNMLIMLDFDREGRLRGIEVLNASQLLCPETLAEAEELKNHDAR